MFGPGFDSLQLHFFDSKFNLKGHDHLIMAFFDFSLFNLRIPGTFFICHTLIVTLKKVAGMEVIFLSELLF